MSVYTLTRDKWRKFKDDNQLSKSSSFKRADVGPHIDSFQKASAAFVKQPGRKNLQSCFTKASDLQKAFNKFVTLKETKEELKDSAVKNQLKAWSNELEGVLVALAKLLKKAEPELTEKDQKDAISDYKKMGLLG